MPSARRGGTAAVASRAADAAAIPRALDGLEALGEPVEFGEELGLGVK